MNRPIYIHYGSLGFDPTKGFPIKNIEHWCKPGGGLWASRVNATFGWKDWCEREEFRDCSERNAFRFVLKKEAKIAVINNLADLRRLPMQPKSLVSSYCIDFQKCYRTGIDAIELCWYGEEYQEVARDDLYFALYGWDCDSIVILNPDIVEVI